MANTDNAYGVLPYQYGGNTLGLKEGTTGSNVTLATGDPLFASAGLLYVASGSQGVYGAAAEPITGATGTQKTVLFWPMDDKVTYKMQTKSSSPKAASQGNIGTSYDVGGSQGSKYLDLENTTTGAFRVVGFVDGTDATATYAEVEVRIDTNLYSGQD